MKKVSGYIVAVIALVIISGFIGYSIAKQQIDWASDLSEKTGSVNESPDSTLTGENRSDLKSYENADLGFSFNYPATYDLSEEETSTTYYVNLLGPREVLTLEILKSSGDNFFSQLPTSKIVTFNNVDWSFHESSEFCDAGDCGGTNPGYTTRNGNLLFSFVLSKPDADPETAIKILSTFKFL